MSAPPSKNPTGPKSYAQAAGEAPPPYSQGAAGPSAGAQVYQQQQQQRQYPQHPQFVPVPQHQTQPLLRSYGAAAAPAGVVVVIPAHQIAVARAKRRFFGALFWAFMIYLVAGTLFGDYELKEGGRHRHRTPRYIIEAEDAAAAAGSASATANTLADTVIPTTPEVDIVPEFN